MGLQHACEGNDPDRSFIPKGCEPTEVGVDVFYAYGFCVHFQRHYQADGLGALPAGVAATELGKLMFPPGVTRDFMAAPVDPRDSRRAWMTPYHWVRTLKAMTEGWVDLNAT